MGISSQEEAKCNVCKMYRYVPTHWWKTLEVEVEMPKLFQRVPALVCLPSGLVCVSIGGSVCVCVCG